MNKFVKVSIIVLGIVLVVGIFFYVKLFIIGNNNYESIGNIKVSVASNSVTLSGSFMDSSRAYKDCEYTLVGNELYVQINSVLVSKKYNSGEFSVVIPVNNIEHIHLTDNKNTKVIYSK